MLDRRRNWWLFAERLCWTSAVLLLLSWGTLRLAGAVDSDHQLARFEALAANTPLDSGPPDLSLWSPARIKAWQDTLNDPSPPPLGILRIPRLRVEAPVLPGTDDATLNRGIGHIEDTALPGTDGNSGLAGHRDSYFRALKDIQPGDVIELHTLAGREHYRVEHTWIVEPEDVSVLDPTPLRTLTLVTCYPFYFVGSAPQRFIVRAVRADLTER